MLQLVKPAYLTLHVPHQTRAHRVPFIRLNHNTGRSAAMLSGTQYMLQNNSCTRLPLLTFGILIAIIVITELE